MPGREAGALAKTGLEIVAGENTALLQCNAASMEAVSSTGCALFIPAGNFSRLTTGNHFSVVSRNKSTQKFALPACFEWIFLRNRSRQRYQAEPVGIQSVIRIPHLPETSFPPLLATGSKRGNLCGQVLVQRQRSRGFNR